MECMNHPGIESAAKCISCGGAICNTCRVDAKNESYCKACIAKKVEGTTTKKRSLGCSIALVALVLVSFIMVAILGLLAAIAIPNFIKAKESAKAKMMSIEKAVEEVRDKIPFKIPKFDISTPEVEVEEQEEVVKEEVSSMQEKTEEPPAPPQNAKTVKIYLKNGHSFEGVIVEETEETILFEIEGGTFSMNKNDIESME